MQNRDLNKVAEEIDAFIGNLPKEGAQSEEELKQDNTSTEQGSHGKDQTEEAKKKNGSNVDESTGKPREADEGAGSNMGTTQMDADDKAEEKSKSLGKVKKENQNKDKDKDNNNNEEEKSMEQKNAEQQEMLKTAQALVDMVKNDKTASEGQKKSSGKKNTGNQGISSFQKVAAQEANRFYNEYLAGLEKRARDEQLVKQYVDQNTIKQYGGVDALLDKLAQENPEAVLPAGAGGAPAAPPAAPAASEGAPAESGGEGDQEAMLEEIANNMEAMGVTAEDMEEAMTLLEDLKAQGYSEEDIAMAAADMLEDQAASAEGGGEEASEGAPAAPAAPEADEAALESPEEEEKEASELQGVLNKLSSINKSGSEKNKQSESARIKNILQRNANRR